MQAHARICKENKLEEYEELEEKMTPIEIILQ